MKPIRKSLLVIVAALAASAYSQETVTLRRLFTEGQEDVYKVATLIDQEIDTSSFGQQSQNMKIDSSMTMTYKLGKFDKEKNQSELEIKVSDMDFKMDLPMGGAEQGMGEFPKTYTIKGKLNQFNQLSDVKIEGLPAMAMMFTGSSMAQSLNVVSFPEQALKIGESWDLKWPKDPLFGGTEPKLKATLKGSKEYEGVPVHEIAIKGVVELRIDPAEMAKAAGAGEADMGMMGGMKMLISGTMDMDTVVLVDRSNGRLVMVDSKGDSNLTLELSDMGITLPIRGKTSSVMKLVTKMG